MKLYVIILLQALGGILTGVPAQEVHNYIQQQENHERLAEAGKRLSNM